MKNPTTRSRLTLTAKITPLTLTPFGGRVRRIRRTPRVAVMSVRYAYQRVVRGWDDRAVWSLDVHVARTLAEQLDVLADRTHGWPGDEEFPEFEDWQNALRENAARLRNYSTHLFNLDSGGELDDVVAEGQAAMRWVADHFPSLWD